MNLFDMILHAQNGGQVEKIAQNFGISSEDARKAIGELMPSLSRGIKKNISRGSGLNELLEALSRGNHQRYIEDPDILGKSETVEEGNKILGHILGSRDVSRNVAGHASNATGLSTGILKKMLPMVATMAMGALSRQTAAGTGAGDQSTGKGQWSSGSGGLASFLDADKDGEIVDDLLNLGKRFF